MRICKRGFESLEINDYKGNVRGCCQISPSGGHRLGSLLDSSLKDIWRGERVREMHERLRDGGAYSFCSSATCPMIANKNLDDGCIDVEVPPEWPISLHISFEGMCNYRCRCCQAHGGITAVRQADREQYARNIDTIASRIEECMPHVKHVVACGSCELFASPRTLELLGSWRTIHDPSEVSAFLQTNGSMFNEQNWSKISNLGRYHLSVEVTVMSFNERIYQYLSGTRRPLDELLDNLRFISSLRRSGAVDFFSIATVVQEMNFLDLPEFTRRCIEEFGADRVGLQSFLSHRADDPVLEWFYDPRNPLHPYYDLYMETLGNEIFSRPDVHRNYYADVRHPAPPTRLPGMGDQTIVSALTSLAECDDVCAKVKGFMARNKLDKLAVYGVGTIGKLFLRTIDGKLEVDALYDRYNTDPFDGRKVLSPNSLHTWGGDTLLVITPVNMYTDIARYVMEIGFGGKIAPITEVIG